MEDCSQIGYGTIGINRGARHSRRCGARRRVELGRRARRGSPRARNAISQRSQFGTQAQAGARDVAVSR